MGSLDASAWRRTDDAAEPQADAPTPSVHGAPPEPPRRRPAARLVTPEPATVDDTDGGSDTDTAGAAPPGSTRALVPTPAPPRAAPVELDLRRLAVDGLLVPGLARTRLTDEMRRLKRALLHPVAPPAAEAGWRGLPVLVTSAVAGEGKTFCAINLALSIAAEIDHSVLLIDANVERPALLRRLRLPPRPGLLDALADDSLPLETLLLRTNVAKLTLLPLGTPAADANERLASVALQQLLAALADRYADRVVVIDGPPLLASTAAMTLARRAGQVLLVVAGGRTPRADVAAGLEMLARCPAVLPLLNLGAPRRVARR